MQGSAYERQLDLDKAIAAYQNSSKEFEQCILTGYKSPDLIIQNDIIKKFCLPKSEEVQQIIKQLTGDS